MHKKLRKVTYRPYGTPAIILSGKLLTERYGIAVGDFVHVEYRENDIRITKAA